jgi:hypothetical protein
VRCGGARRRPAPAFRPVLREVLKVVTAFAAHCSRLLAALGFAHAPSRPSSH